MTALSYILQAIAGAGIAAVVVVNAWTLILALFTDTVDPSGGFVFLLLWTFSGILSFWFVFLWAVAGGMRA